jgi:hypothetical protein
MERFVLEIHALAMDGLSKYFISLNCFIVDDERLVLERQKPQIDLGKMNTAFVFERTD